MTAQVTITKDENGEEMIISNGTESWLVDMTEGVSHAMPIIVCMLMDPNDSVLRKAAMDIQGDYVVRLK